MLYKKRLLGIACLFSMSNVLAMNENAKYYLKFGDNDPVAISRKGMESIHQAEFALSEYERTGPGDEDEFVFELNTLLDKISEPWISRLTLSDIRRFANLASENVEMEDIPTFGLIPLINLSKIFGTVFEKKLLNKLATKIQRAGDDDYRQLFEGEGLLWDVMHSDFTEEMMQELKAKVFADAPRLLRTLEMDYAPYQIVFAELFDGMLAVGGLGSDVFIMNPKTGKTVKKITIKNVSSISVLVGLPGGKLAVGSQYAIVIVDTKTEQQNKLDIEKPRVVDGVVLKDGMLVLAGSMLIRKINPITGQHELIRGRDYLFDPLSLAALPNGMLAAWYADGKIKIIDPEKDKELHEMQGDLQGAFNLVVLSNNDWLASCNAFGDNKKIQIWDWKSGKLVTNIPVTENITNLVPLTNNRLLSYAGDTHRFQIWNINTNQSLDLVLSGLTDKFAAMIMLSDVTLVTGSIEGRKVQVWEIIDFYKDEQGEDCLFEQALLIEGLRGLLKLSTEARDAEIKKMLKNKDLNEIFVSLPKTDAVEGLLKSLHIKREAKAPKKMKSEKKKIVEIKKPTARPQVPQLSKSEQEHAVADIQSTLFILETFLSGEQELQGGEKTIEKLLGDVEKLLEKLEKGGYPAKELVPLKQRYMDLKKYF